MPPAEGWTPVSLPDSWTSRWPDFDGVVWYRVRFDGGCAEGAQLAVSAALSMAGAIYFNGDLLERDVSLREPLSRAWHRPRYQVLPMSLLQAGVNTLLLRVSGLVAYAPGLGAVTVGDAAALQALWEQGQARIKWQWFQLITGAALALIFLTLWLTYRRERSYGWFGLLCAAWAGLIANNVATSVWPLSSTDAWEAAMFIAWALGNGVFPALLLSVSGRKAPRAVAVAWTALALCQVIAMMLAASFSWLTAIVRVRALIEYISAATILVCGIWFILFTPNSRQNGYGVMKITMALMIFGVMNEQLPVVQALVANLYGMGGVIQAAVLFVAGGSLQSMMVTMALILAWRFADDRRQLERFNGKLAAKVTAAREELSRALRQQHELEVAHARQLERLTLADDLHDGLGSTLLNNIAALEREPRDASSERLFTVLCELRDELQNIIETVASDPSDLPPLDEIMAPLRHRIVQVFEARGIQSRWALPEPGAVRLNDARIGVDVLRLLQEGLSNVLRHSGANAVELVAAVKGKTLELTIRDNGCGFDPSAVSVGLGLRSMRGRVKRLGGGVDIQSSAAGTQLRFVIPDVVL
ncbi:MAG: hypothetical protein LBE21_04980 [Pseudomonadales bacterium]|nr:hypothetical protein [Pseudomonadales bacterium]